MSDTHSTQALVERWATYSNDDVTRMVLECYARD